jgi:hypothetical protein
VGKLSSANPQREEPTPRKTLTYESLGVDVCELSATVVQQYLGSYKIVSGLAQQYGFDYLFFVPPAIFLGDKPLTPEEQEMERRDIEAAFSKLCIAVYQTIERESPKYQNLYSLVHIFDHDDALLWIEATHVTPTGNQLIAARMLDVLQAQASVSVSKKWDTGGQPR